MRHKTSKALFAYWNEVRADRLAPQRFEIDPSKISAILPYTFILERIDAETYRYRLAGTHVCEIFGSELRGTNFLGGWPVIDRPPLLRLFSVLTRQGAAAVISMKVATLCEQTVECEVLLLPLRHTRDTIDRILGSFAPLEAPGWLGDKPVASKHFVANELIWPAQDPRPQISPVPAEEPAASHGRNARIIRSERRQFRVVDGGLSRTDWDKT
jgi:hypothetical protein